MYGGFALNLLNDTGLGTAFLNHAQQIEYAKSLAAKRNQNRSTQRSKASASRVPRITANGDAAAGSVVKSNGSLENIDVEHGMETIDLLATSYDIALKQDLFDDDLAIVIIGGHADHTLGLMLSVNIAIGNIFGRMQSELVGHNVNVLMPSPFAELHDEFLANFARRASSQNSMLNRTRRLMGMKKNGDVFPIELTLRQVSPSASICI